MWREIEDPGIHRLHLTLRMRDKQSNDSLFSAISYSTYCWREGRSDSWNKMSKNVNSDTAEFIRRYLLAGAMVSTRDNGHAKKEKLSALLLRPKVNILFGFSFPRWPLMHIIVTLLSAPTPRPSLVLKWRRRRSLRRIRKTPRLQ